MNTQRIYLEHANITVNNIDSAVDFFQAAFPDFNIRGGGNHNGRKWIHLGNDDTYIAINEAFVQQVSTRDYTRPGINHLGFVVEDADVIADRLLAAGYKRDYPKQEEKYRIRDYFLDADGNEYEFVQYLSEKTQERNFYDAVG